jgi:hypothetical protein
MFFASYDVMIDSDAVAWHILVCCITLLGTNCRIKRVLEKVERKMVD